MPEEGRGTWRFTFVAMPVSRRQRLGVERKLASASGTGSVQPPPEGRPAGIRPAFAGWKSRLVARALAVANQPGDRAKLLVRRCARQAFNRAVEVDDALTDWGHDGSAAMLSACRSCHCRLAQRLINLFNQEPSPAIGHSQVSRRGRNRPLGANGFEQRDLARTDAVTVGKVETNREVRICHGQGHTGMCI